MLFYLFEKFLFYFSLKIYLSYHIFKVLSSLY
uniref:Uncharacterized protein n=1 Tax=Siphoviridae sp. ctLqe90 TaxID=2825456 RepID=A0A8S5Q3C5_9CAUD|nr:MAG TPA: hypothetical protein [Siphoviridae sp. ctLqe90]